MLKPIQQVSKKNQTELSLPSRSSEAPEARRLEGERKNGGSAMRYVRAGREKARLFSEAAQTYRIITDDVVPTPGRDGP